MAVNRDICLTGNTLDNIKKMAPHLTKKKQHIVFGMVLGMVTQNEPDKDKNQKPAAEERG